MNILPVIFAILLAPGLGYGLRHLRRNMRDIRSMQATLPRPGDGSVFDIPDPVNTPTDSGYHHDAGHAGSDAGGHHSGFDGGGHGGFDGGHGDFGGHH